MYLFLLLRPHIWYENLGTDSSLLSLPNLYGSVVVLPMLMVAFDAVNRPGVMAVPLAPVTARRM